MIVDRLVGDQEVPVSQRANWNAAISAATEVVESRFPRNPRLFADLAGTPKGSRLRTETVRNGGKPAASGLRKVVVKNAR